MVTHTCWLQTLVFVCKLQDLRLLCFFKGSEAFMLPVLSALLSAQNTVSTMFRTASQGARKGLFKA